MCGRFARTTSAAVLAELLELAEVPELFPRYNVAPTQAVPAARLRPDGARELALLRWGLVPSWGDPKRPMINARSETAASKPAFRARRCPPAAGRLAVHPRL